MKCMKKFATQIDSRVLEEFRAYAKESNRSISGLLTDAVSEYLARVRVRAPFRDAADAVLAENEELLRRLAK